MNIMIIYCSILELLTLRLMFLLHITHRLPDTLANLVDDFAEYGGLASAPEVAGRRLNITDIECVDYTFKQIINPDEVVTWIDMCNKLITEKLLMRSLGSLDHPR